MKRITCVLFVLAVALAGCADSGVHEKNGIKGVRYGSPLRSHYVCGVEEC